ncbi:MAG: TonB-dependent receptor [Bacteroidetes bacterium]|nr:TonB-dependent receptor [Bacteroidota bacterium]
MKSALILGMLLLCATLARAQVLTIRDDVTGRPLAEVSAYSGRPPAIARSNVRGRIDLTPFRGADSIRFDLIGHRTVWRSYDSLVAGGLTVYMEETPFRTGEVIVSATRWQLQKREVPARSLTMHATDIEREGPQTAADMLGASGEVFIQKSQLGGGSPILRGFATNRVLLVVDGVRMNTAIFRSGNVQNVISIDPLALERTEVVFGPGSVMYGSDAIGGVMSFSTMQPRLANGGGGTLLAGDVALRTGSANFEKTGHADLMIGLRRWGFLSSVTFSDFGDLRMGSDGPDAYLRPRYVERFGGRDSIVTNDDPERQVPSGYSMLSLMQKIRFQPDAHWDLTYGAHYSRTSDYARYDRLLRPRGDGLRSAEWYYGPQIWMMHALNITHGSGGVLYDDMRATLAYQFFEESRHDRDFGGSTLRHRTESVDAYSANVDFSKSFTADQTLYYGVEALHNVVSSFGEDEDIATGAVVPGPSRYPDGSTWTSLAAYANYRNRVSDWLALQAGLRYNRVALDAEFDPSFYPFSFTEARLRNGALNGSFGTVLSLREDTQLSLGVATGFRAPNIDDAGKVFDSAPGSVVVPNPDLTPEFATNVEAGLTQRFGDVLRFEVTGYHTWLTDALVRRDYTLNGRDSIMYDGTPSRVQAIQNAAEAWVQGVQLAVEFQLGAGFRLVAHLNWQKGEEQLDDGSAAPLRHAAPFFGLTRLFYKRHRFEAELAAVYNGEVGYEDLGQQLDGRDYLYAVDANGNPYTPAWTIFNLKARYQLTDMLRFSAGVENILDTRYRPYSSGITAAGRNLTAGVYVTL